MANEPDLTEFHQLSRPRRKPCSVLIALEQLKPADREKATAAIAVDSGVITNVAVAQWFNARGLDTSWQNVAAHRRNICTCDG